MLHIGTWFWGDKYSPGHLAKLEAGVKRHVKQPYRWSVFHPRPEDMLLTRIQGCFARLRMFDPEWQQRNGIEEDERLVCLDLDSVVINTLDPLFDRTEPFVILQGANASNPCPFNGSVMMLRGGYRPDVWSDFSLDAAATIQRYQFADDQGWLWHKLPEAAGWQVGSASGIYAFRKPGWPSRGTALPRDARLVVFPGWRDPSKFIYLPWIRDNWV